jgi:Transcriptional regulatory protein, C terminal
MPTHYLRLQIDNPVLERLITEQLAMRKEISLDPVLEPDCLIIQSDDISSPSTNPIILSLPSKGVIRLGEILDRLGYLLSRREDHIEDDNLLIDLGLFILRPSENSLLHKQSQQIIQLTDKERMLLRYLYESGSKGMPRKELLKSVWGYAEEAETHTLETHIYRLRQKLEPFAADTIIKVQDGYYMISV